MDHDSFEYKSGNENGKSIDIFATFIELKAIHTIQSNQRKYYII